MKTLWIGVLSLVLLAATALPVQAQRTGNCAGQVGPNGQCIGGPPQPNVAVPAGQARLPQPQLTPRPDAQLQVTDCKAQCASGRPTTACAPSCVSLAPPPQRQATMTPQAQPSQQATSRQAPPTAESCRSQCGDGTGKAANACLARCGSRR